MSGAIDHARPLDDAWQLAPERGRKSRNDPRHRLRIGRLRRPQFRNAQRSRGRPEAGDGDPFHVGPVDEAASRRPLRVTARDRRRRPERRAEQEPGLPDAIGAP